MGRRPRQAGAAKLIGRSTGRLDLPKTWRQNRCSTLFSRIVGNLFCSLNLLQLSLIISVSRHADVNRFCFCAEPQRSEMCRFWENCEVCGYSAAIGRYWVAIWLLPDENLGIHRLHHGPFEISDDWYIVELLFMRLSLQERIFRGSCHIM